MHLRFAFHVDFLICVDYYLFVFDFHRFVLIITGLDQFFGSIFLCILDFIIDCFFMIIDYEFMISISTKRLFLNFISDTHVFSALFVHNQLFFISIFVNRLCTQGPFALCRIFCGSVCKKNSQIEDH